MFEETAVARRLTPRWSNRARTLGPSRLARRGIVACGAAASLAFGAALVSQPPALGAATAPSRHDATVYGYGAATFAGSPGTGLPSPLTGMAGLAGGRGYWVARADGAVYHYGAAAYLGSPRAARPRAAVVAIASHPKAPGYWVVTSAGQVFAYGAADFFGDPYPAALNSPVVGIAATGTGKGYWLVSRSGGIRAYGDAQYYGSAFGRLAGSTAVGMASTPSGRGYWIASANGGVFSFGKAGFHGSAFGRTSRPIAGIARTYRGFGYYLLDTTGGVFAFGDGGWLGSARTSMSFVRRAVAIAAPASRAGYWLLADDQPASAVVAAPGLRGTGAAAVQAALLRRGFWLGPSGVFDDLTTQAVYAFQKVVGRARTGVLTMADWNALVRLGRPAPRSPTGYLVEVDKARQVLIVAQNGTARWVFNTSTGTDQPYVSGGAVHIARTPEGRFTLLREVSSGWRVGPLGALWRPKYFTADGIAIHGSNSVPPYPASHGCVRLSITAMDFVWRVNLMPLGTTVYVY